MKKSLVAVVAVLVVVLALTACLAACNNSGKNYTFGKEVVPVNAQFDILTGMSTGSADIGVMDSIMAGYYMSSENYKDTMEILPFYLSEEEYAIGAKKGNDALIGKINEALIALQVSGEMATIGDTFGVASENLVTATTANPKATATDNSWNNVVADGTLVIGYTVFAPIAFSQGSTFTGYDIELARAVVSYLNQQYGSSLVIDFMEIDWDQKEALLENGTIDLVWNGMTATEERANGMSLSISYLANKQAIVILKKDKANYDLTSLEAFKKSAAKAVVYVESGSAAEELMIVEK